MNPPDSITLPLGHRRFTPRKMLIWALAIGLVVAAILLWLMCSMESALEKSRVDPNRMFYRAVKTALGTYRIDMGDYPSTAEGWQALVKVPAGNPNAANWRGPYLEFGEQGWPAFYRPEFCQQPLHYLLWRISPRHPAKEPTDSWGRPFRYAYPSVRTSSTQSTGTLSPTATVPRYDVWSLGPDGIDGTDDDIGNW
jgi:general secretion pathway protein G